MDASSLVELLLLWTCLIFSAILLAIALRLRAVEREEGLPTSWARVLGVGTVCVLVLGLVVLSTRSAFAPVEAVRPVETVAPPETEAIQKLRGEQATHRKRIEEIDAQIVALQREVAPVGKEAGTDEAVGLRTEAGPGFDFLRLAVIVVPILLVVGVGVLVLFGDRLALLRVAQMLRLGDLSEIRAKALRDLDALTAAADGGRFREGLDIADALDVGLLESIDQLDWSYLKSYCAVQLALEMDGGQARRRELLDQAVRYLGTLLEQAPNRGEAAYLLATAHAFLGDEQAALDAFTRAKSLISDPGDLPFAENESVCLLHLAESKLGEGDAEGATRLFDEVTRRGVMVDKVPTSLVKIRLLNVRRSLQAGQADEALKGLEIVRKVEGLDPEQSRSVAVLCDALEALIAAQQDDPLQVAERVGTFLARHVPRDLPEPDDEIADEYLGAPVSAESLPLPPQIFRAFLVQQAEAAARLVSRGGTSPSRSQVEEIARPLRRALQFELRQRDVLAALGGLYYWFVPEKRRKAIGWLEAAVEMGVESPIARRILDRARSVEAENREVMEWFRSTSSRFLHDPTLSAAVRQALVEEMGRFQEFEPMLLELESADDFAPREPTLRLLRERAGYLDRMLADLATRKTTTDPALHGLRQEYARLIAGIDVTTGQLADVERRLVQEVGKLVLH